MTETPTAVPIWDRLLHEIWWLIFRWPASQRVEGRAALRDHYVRKSVPREPQR